MGYVVVGTNVVFVLTENPFRTYCSFVNNSSNKIHIKLGYGATTNDGITLNPSASFEITLDNPYYGVVTAIAEAGSSNNLAVNELSSQ